MHKHVVLFCLLIFVINSGAQTPVSHVWASDNGDNTFKNPVLFADYSDPDAIRVGDDYFMVTSSFGHFPGLPVLHSKDMINWEIIAHVVDNYPFPEFEKPQHGFGIWAPAIRFHNNEYYIYFGDPDRGIFMTKAKNPAGPWEPLKLIRRVTGWIDCCPFWDEDGSAYLVHAFANSRCGIKSILAVNKMNPEGTEIYDDGILVFNGQKDHPTMEGAKFYKRNGYYYIFAPAGGVKPGWQVVLRSKNLFGPYEDKITLEQGGTKVNGPHQGAWLTTQTGEDWFLHFQDRYAYGRIVHLQPMKWVNDWPVMGFDYDKNGIGEPMSSMPKPNVGAVYPILVPQTTDEFDSSKLGLQWQWESNYKHSWYSLTARTGYLRLFSEKLPDQDNLWNIGRLLLQKMPAGKFTATAKLELNNETGTKAGLLVFGQNYSYIGLARNNDGFVLSQVECIKAQQGGKERSVTSVPSKNNIVYLRVNVYPENEADIIPKVLCDFSFSYDGVNFERLGETFTAKEGMWVGAKIGVFCIGNDVNSTYADVDWFRLDK